MNSQTKSKFLPTTHYPLPTTRGFTLPELLIAMGLFAVVISIASGAFLQALRSQRAAVELIALNDNMNLVLEEMAREIRLGKSFSVPADGELRFVDSYGRSIYYRLDSSAGTLTKKVGTGDFELFSSPAVNLRRMIFATAGIGKTDGRQVKITLSIRLSGRSERLKDVYSDIQTTVSPRVLDI